MQSTLETETRTKQEAIRQKKKLEADMNELGIALEHANAANDEAQQTIKQHQRSIKDYQNVLEQEQLQRDKAREQLIQAERKYHGVSADLEEMLEESRIADERAKKAMVDAARLADELRTEQNAAQNAEKNRKTLDCQVKDMQTKLDEAEQLAVKGGKKVVTRLEQKIGDLENQ